MGNSETESCRRCLWTQFKHLHSQVALRLGLVIPISLGESSPHVKLIKLKFYKFIPVRHE